MWIIYTHFWPATVDIFWQQFDCITDLPGWRCREGKCYLYVRDAVNWDWAQQSCQRRNSTLVSVSKSEENNFIGSLVRSTVWIGLNDRVEAGTCVWWRKSHASKFLDCEWSLIPTRDKDCGWNKRARARLLGHASCSPSLARACVFCPLNTTFHWMRKKTWRKIPRKVVHLLVNCLFDRISFCSFH